MCSDLQICRVDCVIGKRGSSLHSIMIPPYLVLMTSHQILFCHIIIITSNGRQSLQYIWEKITV